MMLVSHFHSKFKPHRPREGERLLLTLDSQDAVSSEHTPPVGPKIPKTSEIPT